MIWNKDGCGLSAADREPGSLAKPAAKLRELQAHAAKRFPCCECFPGGRSASTRSCVERTDRALHNVFQLAHVAGPVVVHHELHGRLRELPERLAFSWQYRTRKCASKGARLPASRNGGIWR